MANGIDKTTLAPDRTHVKSTFVSALCTRLGVNDRPDTVVMGSSVIFRTLVLYNYACMENQE